jgi:glucose/arabinose dehydrogenase
VAQRLEAEYNRASGPGAYDVKRSSRCTVIALGGILLACATEENPAPVGALRLVPVDSGYDFPIFVAAPPGDRSRLFVVERGGAIHLRRDRERQGAPFLDLTSRTGGAHEYGVYSIAFHPQYGLNRRVYAYYVDNDGRSRISRFLADGTGDRADPSSEQVVLTQDQVPGAVLYGGMIGFGPDRKLYVALGDGVPGAGPASAAQDSGSFMGKMLRLDVDAAEPYAVPADNPYVARPGWRPEIWQLGLRNPWRWSFDRETGDLYIGDVGEDLLEEVDVLEAPVEGGNNFGWPFMEGDGCFEPAAGCETAGLVTPRVQYPHGPTACSVTGGLVYRGGDFPGLRGTYLYSDFCGGWIRSFRLEGGAAVEAYSEVPAPLAGGLTDNAVSFGADADGEIYVVYASGRIYRVEEQVTP